MTTPDITTTRGKARLALASAALQGMLASRMYANETKKRMCDNAIGYADMMLRRLAEIPQDAQERSESESKRPRIREDIDWETIEKISNKQ